MRHWKPMVCVGLALLWAASLPGMGIASPHSGALPNLSVSSGSISQSNGRLVGKVVVLNKGSGPAAKSSGALVVKGAGKGLDAGRFSVSPLDAGAKKTVRVSVELPSNLPAGPASVKACADANQKIKESAEGDNCRKVGTIQIAARSTTPTSPTPAPVVGPPAPPSSVPSNPIPFTAGTPAQVTASGAAPPYWLYVPRSYDSTNQTPTKLFVWLHGCSGVSSGDIYTVDPEAGGGQATQDWISVGVGGREGDCWDVDVDVPKVLATIADVKTHFNIDPHRVILGGYSSGGDLAYRTAFYNSSAFAGLLIENSAPFRDTGSTQSQSLAAATTKFHVVHLAHQSDETYPLDEVESEVQAMTEAGFPISLVERPGGHSDDTTDPDLVTYLLPHIDDGWLSP